MSVGRLVARTVIGGLFIGHGTQKLFGWFGGHRLEGTAGFFENVGLRPGRRNAIAAGASEALGGLLLTLGAFTPVATTMIAGTMVTAIRKVHAPNGPWVTEQGYEYNLVIIAAMAALADRGPGSPSVDAKLLPGMKGADDMDALTSLIHEDAKQSMPPFDMWLAGRDDIFTWWFGPGIGCRGSRVIPTVSANGSPAFGQYKPSDSGDGYDPWALQVLEIENGRIAEFTFFLATDTLFPLFGLPSRLAA